jgi:hypothetical protein
MGAEAGLTDKMADTLAGDTMDAHRVVHFQLLTVEHLHSGHFAEEADAASSGYQGDWSWRASSSTTKLSMSDVTDALISPRAAAKKKGLLSSLKLVTTPPCS